MGPLRVLGVTTGSGSTDTADGGGNGTTADGSATDGGTTGPDATADNTPATAADDSAPPTTTPLTGLAIAHVADVDAAGAKRFHVPSAAPAAYRPGDPGVIVKLADGSYAAYDARCTHEGCRVGYDRQDGILLCPCHGAAFDPSDHGAVLGGPTRTPLLELPLEIDPATGTISIKA
jgi:thiosulfate dehydrogenase [quinone] large subunit